MHVKISKLYSVDDEEVIEEVLNGNTAAYEQLMRKYNQRLFRIGHSYLHNENDVEDAMQNTYLKAFEVLGGFNRASLFSTWLTRIMINECLQLLRKHRPYEEIKLDMDLPEMVISSQNAEEEIITNEMKRILEKSILKLPPKYRVVYVMREVEEIPTIKTAGILNITESNVKARLSRAKKMLREEILKCGDGVEVFTYGNEKCDRLVEKGMNRILSNGIDRHTTGDEQP